MKIVHMKYKTAIIRKEHFNAAHRLHNPHWSDEKNREIFGKCNNPNYHGHNYNVEVKVVGYIDEDSGYVMDAKILKNLIREYVVEKFDHKNLNLDTEEFKNLNPTAENIATVIYKALRSVLPDELELKIKLYETERNIVEYPAG
jgi:6-pyruvoyltetrahydropterin/6-carboxytetrahydropterin synthase